MEKTDTKTENFEMQLASLERIVRELERGDLPLEKSLELFEQGVRLSRQCQERLNDAERRIEVLLRDGNGRMTLTAFDEENLSPAINSESENDDDDENVF